MKTPAIFATSLASGLFAVAYWASPAGADTLAEFTTAGATVNSSLLTFPGSGDSLFPANNELALSGSDLFVANTGFNSIGEYTTAGATVHATLVSDLSGPYAIAVSGSDLFVLNENGTIGEYTTAGATVNATLVSGLPTELANSIAVSGGDLFVTRFDFSNPNQTSVSEYTTGGALVNASLITGLPGPLDVVASGGDLFFANYWNGTIGEYTTAGAVVNAALVQGLNSPSAIAISGSDLFVATGPTIGEYTTSGATVKTTLISTAPALYSDGLVANGSDVFDSLYVLPEPSAFVLLAVGSALLAARSLRKRRRWAWDRDAEQIRHEA